MSKLGSEACRGIEVVRFLVGPLAFEQSAAYREEPFDTRIPPNLHLLHFRTAGEDFDGAFSDINDRSKRYV